MPWDDVTVTFGVVTIAWASAQMGIIQLLKGITVGNRKLLGTSGAVWLANAALGVLGLTLAATQADVPLLAAFVQALLAVFAASGEHEFFGMTDKLVGKSGESKPTGTE